MKQPTLFLHIGSGKTGTSSLQAFLADNSDLLQSKGICYTEYDAYNGKQHINVYDSLWLAFYNMLNAGKGLPAASNSITEAIDSPDNLFGKMKCAFDKMNCNALIISSETFFAPVAPSTRFGLTIPGDTIVEDTRQLRWYITNAFKKFFPEFNVKIVCYLRRQDKFIESAYNQFCKMSSQPEIDSLLSTRDSLNYICTSGYKGIDNISSETFNAFFKKRFRSTEYEKILLEWSAIYGKENIIIRPYERCQMPKGVIYDFLKNVLGFDEDDIPTDNMSISLNDSLKRDLLEYKMLIEKEEGPSIQGVCLSINESQALKNINDNQNYLSVEERANLLEYHQMGNTRIAREYLNKEDGILFYEEIPSHQDDYPGLSVQSSIMIAREIIKEERKRIERHSHNANVCYERLIESKEMRSSVNVAIYGSGEGAYAILHYFQKTCVESAKKIRCIIENDGPKIGGYFYTLPIKSIQRAIEEDMIDTIIIGSHIYQEIIYNRISYLIEKRINIIKVFG